MTEKLCHIANRHEPPARACLPKNQMEVLMKKLLKLPLQIATLPLIAILLVFQLISSIIVGLTSIVTNLLATVFLFGSLAGWIAQRTDLPDGGPWHLLRLCSAHRWMAAGEGNRPHARSSGLSTGLMHQVFLLAFFRHSAEQNRESARGA